MTAIESWRVFSLITKSPRSPGYIFPRDLLPTILQNLFEKELIDYYDVDDENPSSIINKIILDGNLSLLQYFNKKYPTILQKEHSRGVNFISCAAIRGRLEIITYLHKKLKLTGDNHAVVYAAGNGFLNIVIYLHEQMGLICAGSLMEVIKNGHLSCLVYMREKMGRKFNNMDVLTANKYKQVRIVDYINKYI